MRRGKRETPGYWNEISASRRRRRSPFFQRHSRQPVASQKWKFKTSKFFPKLQKKIMDKFLSSDFDSEPPEYYPEDFQGAAPGDGIFYVSSDDEMECASSASVDDLDNLSDNDEVALLAECIERQMELPTAFESIPVPTCSSQQGENRARTPRLSYIPGPMFDAGYFDLGMGRGPVASDPRLRNDHPINICSQLIPMVDTPMSPPAVDKYPTGDWRAVAWTSTNNNQQSPSRINPL